MDVVNGKIVSARTESSRSDLWSALKPSRSVLESPGPYPHAGKPDQLAGSYNALRGLGDWGAGPSNNISGSTSPPHSWGALSPGHGSLGVATSQRQAPASTMAPSMALEPGTGRWNRSPRDNILGQPHKQSLAHFLGSPYGGESPLHGSPAASWFVQGPAPRLGWKRSAGPAVPGRNNHHTRPCTHSESRALFDEEMTMYESQICRAVSGHFDSLTPVTPAAPAGVTAEESLETRAGFYTLKRQGTELSENIAGEDQDTGAATNTVKRKKTELCENDQGDCAWVPPLRFLIRKGLSVSDVGELGRIVLPKKDAEGQLPQIDTKEGKLLEMEDYSISKRWAFRYKWWINNKSRMYVLENTGEFIKHHGLKERDSFVVYEDGCGKLVARGQKKTTSRLDSTVDAPKPGSSNIEISKSDKPPTSTEDESCRVTPTTPLATFALD